MDKKNIEKAVVLDAPDMAGASGPFLKRHDLIYIGSEFCQNIFPVKEEVSLLFGKGARKIVILTPFMVMERLAQVQTALSAIIGEFKDIEIMVNDLGLLSYLNKFHPRTVKGMGRPLSIDFMRMDHKSRAKFFKEQKLSRIETDEPDLLGNLPRDPGFKISLHYPLKFAAMTRLCPFVRKITLACGHNCYGRTLALPVPGGGGQLIAKNNAYFTEYKPGKPGNVDRFVKHSFDAARQAA